MKKLCEICQSAITAGSVKLDPVLSAHLAECPECRDFAAFQESVLRAAPAVPEAMPKLADILAERSRRQLARRRTLRLVVMPLTLAAAALVAVAGLTFTLGTEAVPAASPVMQTLAAADTWQSESTFSDELSADSLNLVWDSMSVQETSCRNLLAAVRQDGSGWSIEEYDLTEEEMEI